MPETARNAERLTDTLDHLVYAVAVAPPEARRCLDSCRLCRNSVLYLLDTVPLTGNYAIIEHRIRALPDHHRLSHQNPAARDHGDARTPQIRGISYGQ